MVGLLFVALLVGPATAALLWSHGIVIAALASSFAASAAVMMVATMMAYRRPARPRRRQFHERGTARARFGREWHVAARA